MMSANSLEIRMARLEGICEQIDKRLGDLVASIESRFSQTDARFGQIESRFSLVDSRFAEIDSHFGRLEQKTDSLGWRLTSLILVTWVSTMLAIFFRH